MARAKESFLRGLLAGMTYFILFLAIFIFCIIVKDGAPVLFKAEAPFINL